MNTMTATDNTDNTDNTGSDEHKGEPTGIVVPIVPIVLKRRLVARL
jgi:hypothetical protein